MKIRSFFAAIILLTVAACNSSKEANRLTTPQGVEYEVLKKGTGKKVEVGDVVTFHLQQLTNTDSVFFTTYDREPFVFQVAEASTYEDPSGWLQQLSVGDSAAFYLLSDSIYTQSPPPPFVKAGDTVKFIFNVVDAKPESEYMVQQNQKASQLMQQQVQTIEQQLQQQNIAFEKTPDDIIYVMEQKGTGAAVKQGDRVKVHYTLKTLDGNKLESSRDRGEPFTFTIGAGEVIPGWDKALTLFNVGGKGTIYLPSSLAYGEQGSQNIPPNTPLVFEIEVVEVVDQEAAMRESNKQLEDYLKKNNINAQKTPEGLYYTVEKKGTGPSVQPGQTVSVNYTGRLLNGTVFDTSVEDVAKANNLYNPQRPYQPIEFPIGQGRVIKGWDMGIPLFNVGGKGKLYIPANLAYGERGAGGMIPPNSPLIFDVEVVGVK